MGGTFSTYGGQGGAYRGLVGTLWGKTPLQIPRCRWKDNIKMNPIEIQWHNVNWINLAWGTYKLHDLLNINEPFGSINCRVQPN
jgi:hypothetical protein